MSLSIPELSILTIEELKYHFTEDQIKQSTYTIGSRQTIRLFNSNAEVAKVKALMPNILKIKKQFKGYDNIKWDIHEYDNGEITGNRKVDMIIEPIGDL